jgi:peptidyl-prolyl cis-trans isomerase C
MIQRTGEKSLRVLVTVFALLVAASPALAQDKQPSKTEIAVVNGSVITQAEFDGEMTRVRERFLRTGRPLSDSQLSQVKKDVLENLISIELLYQETQKRGIQVDEATVNEQLSTLKKRFPSEAEFESAMRKMNLSEPAIKSQFKREMAIQQLIDEQFTQKAAVSEDEIKTFYESRLDSFKQPEQVRARHILMKVDPQADESQRAEARKKLEMIQQKLQKGEDFEALAKEYSEGPSSAKGGDLGYFGRGQMAKPFEEAAFALRSGEVSDIVETKFGYHLIEVIDRKPETTVALEDVRGRIEQYLKQQKVQENVRMYVEDLKEEADVKRLVEIDS